MHLYGLSSCDTCRRALKELTEASHVLEVTDVRADGIPAGRLRQFYAELGCALINRRSATWRGLDAGERARDPVDLLADHPTLMKRPVIDDGTRLSLGWTAETRAALL